MDIHIQTRDEIDPTNQSSETILENLRDKFKLRMIVEYYAEKRRKRCGIFHPNKILFN